MAAIILTNLVLLPVALSYVHFEADYPERLHRRGRLHGAALAAVRRRDRARARRWSSSAWPCCWASLGVWKGGQVQIGDLHRGVPELRADSRYNTDSAVVTSKFSIGVDVLNVIAETKPRGLRRPWRDDDHRRVLVAHGRTCPASSRPWTCPGVAKTLNAGWNEGSPEVAGPRAQPVGADPVGDLRADVERAAERRLQRDARHALHPRSQGRRPSRDRGRGQAVRSGAREQGRLVQTGDGQRRRDGGDQRGGGVPRSGRSCSASSGRSSCSACRGSGPCAASLCILIPLGLVSLLSYALMTVLEIGLKVNTLPVAALGVGVGVDYGIYLYSRFRTLLPGGRFAARGVLQDARGDGQRRVLHRPDPGDGRGDLDVLAAQVPGGHGPAAGVPVPDEHGRRAGAAAGAGRAHPARREASPGVAARRRHQTRSGWIASGLRAGPAGFKLHNEADRCARRGPDAETDQPRARVRARRWATAADRSGRSPARRRRARARGSVSVLPPCSSVAVPGGAEA